MEWLQIIVLLGGSVGLGFVGYKLLGSGYRLKKPPPSLLSSKAPTSLTLTAIGNERWQKGGTANALATPFLTRGFADAGCYSVRETPGTIIRFLLKEDEAILVSVLEDAKAVHWVEVATFYDDGTEWCYSTRSGDAALHTPGSTRYFAPKLLPESLYGKLKIERPRKKTRKLTVNNVDAEYATVWATHQKWLKDQGRA